MTPAHALLPGLIALAILAWLYLPGPLLRAVRALRARRRRRAAARDDLRLRLEADPSAGSGQGLSEAFPGDVARLQRLRERGL